MDIAVNLVESYLRLSGYLTLSEFEVQRRAEFGYETVTDVDIMALRLPSADSPCIPGSAEPCRPLILSDPVLMLSPDTIDVVIGEVKQGAAEFNPGITRHEVLHTMLRRVAWLYEEPVEDVVSGLQQRMVRATPARGGGTVRTRLVAFGRAPQCDLHTISLSHIVRTVLAFFAETGDAFTPMQFRDPAPAMLALLMKTGFEVRKD